MCNHFLVLLILLPANVSLVVVFNQDIPILLLPSDTLLDVLASILDLDDPLGFAMENYDPTGMWRDRYENGRTVDPSGILLKKHIYETQSHCKNWSSQH